MSPSSWSQMWGPAAAWPIIGVGSSLLAVTAVVADVGQPVQTILVMWFVLVCPGMSLVRMLGLGSLLWESTLAVGLSLALTVVVAQALLASGWWSPRLGLAVLVAITVAGSGLQVVLGRRVSDASAATAARQGGSR